MNEYDYLIVGAGLFGAVFAHEAHTAGKRVLVVERRQHIGGNIYTENVRGIPVHRYGAHIFHTDDEEVWTYVNRFAKFNRFIHTPMAMYGKELYHLPFNMNTFQEMWGVTTPSEARAIIAEQRKEILCMPRNLEEQAIALVGRDIYKKLIKGYTEKQWGKPCHDLPAFIIQRLPVRFTYDNNYFSDAYQGIPVDGYTPMVARLLEGIEVRLNTDFDGPHDSLAERGRKIVYTGTIDRYYGYRFGALAYRSLQFDTVEHAVHSYQGHAVINATSADVPYTRVIEHKYFANDCPTVMCQPHTVVTYEYSKDWMPGRDPYYPVNDDNNNGLYKAYCRLSNQDKRIIFGGRLGLYQYMDMDDTIRAALNCARNELGGEYKAV